MASTDFFPGEEAIANLDSSSISATNSDELFAEIFSASTTFASNLFLNTTTSIPSTEPTTSTSTVAFTTSLKNGPSFVQAINSTHKIDLQMLWKLLEQGQTLGNSNVSGARVIGLNEASLHELDAKTTATTWQLAIIQGVLLAMLVVLSILWAFCCRKIRQGDQPLIAGISEQVVALARKISNGSTRDLPPSYSKVDLTQVGLTINDHLNPPPHYDIVTDEELSGDSRRHRRRISRFSLSSLEAEAGFRHPPSRSVSDRTIPDSEIIPPGIIRPTRLSTTSTASGISFYCTLESEASSRRASRVTFAPNLESGPSRRDSSQSLPLQSALASKSSRKSSSHSEGSNSSRRVSFIDEMTGKSSRPDPILEERLRCQLDAVREAGEMGEFVAAAEPATSISTATIEIEAVQPYPLDAISSESFEKSLNEIENETTTGEGGAAASSTTLSASLTSTLGEPKKKKSFCHLPEDDIKNKELFI